MEHLARGLGEARCTVSRVMSSRTESKKRQFGQDLWYWNANMDDFLEMVEADPGPILICINDGGSDVADYLIRCKDAWFVFHDYRSLQDMTVTLRGERTIMIREANVHHVPGSTFIPHPYERFFTTWTPTLEVPFEEREPACAHTRIDFDKRTHLLLAANDLLDGDTAIIVKGRENRMYGKFTLQASWPEWNIGKNEFPRGHGAPARFCSGFKLDFDMTLIKGDGGGSQYSFLEAMDAGCIPVIATDWGDVPFKAIQVEPTPEGVAHPLIEIGQLDEEEFLAWYAENSRYLAETHCAKKVADQYVEVMNG
jgi:hypothetical protein